MPRSASLVPDDTNQDVYLVLDDFGSLGRVWRETDEAGTNRAWMVRNILEGLYENPVRIVAFNTAEGWSRDVTVDVADELRRRFVEYDDRGHAAVGRQREIPLQAAQVEIAIQATDQKHQVDVGGDRLAILAFTGIAPLETRTPRQHRSRAAGERAPPARAAQRPDAR